MTIELLHMLSGEDVIAEISSGQPRSETVLVKNPCVMMLIPNPQQPDKVQIQLRPLCPFTAQKTIPINLNLVVYRVKALPELENEYNVLFGSGLTIVPASALTGIKESVSKTSKLTRIK